MVFQFSTQELEQVLTEQAASETQRRRVAETVASLRQAMEAASCAEDRNQVLTLVLSAAVLIMSDDGGAVVTLLEVINQMSNEAEPACAAPCSALLN